MLFLVAVSGLLVFFVNSLINVLGESRVDLLKQVAERSKVINKAAIIVCDKNHFFSETDKACV